MIPVNQLYKNKIIILAAALVIAGAALIFVPYKKANAPSVSGQPKNIENKNKDSKKCAIEKCHGLDDLTCGENAPEMCTEEYQMGDACRKYVRCEAQNGQCQKIESDKFGECKSCIEKCIEKFGSDAEKSFNCEGECHLKLNETDSPELE